MTKSRIDFKTFLPYIIAILSFVIFSMAYFSPQYKGEVLRMDDMVQAQGMGHDINEHITKYNEHPQWTGGMFGGMPAYLINMNYDGRIVKYTGDSMYFIGQPAAYFFIAMLAFFFMLLCFGVNPWLAMVGAFGYGLSTYFYIIIAVGHITKMIALAFAPAIVGGVYLTYNKNILLGAALTGLFAGMEIAANHIQITYYFLFVLIALFINELVKAVKTKMMPRFLKATLALVFAAVLAVGANFNQLYYVASHSTQTMRGGSEISGMSKNKNGQTSDKGLDLDYATHWSYGKAETFNMFIPNLMGGSSQGGFSEDGEVANSLKSYNARGMAAQLPSYWGPQPFTAGPVYIGAVLIFLFVLGMFVLRGAVKWWIFGVTILSILLAWGNNMMWLTEFFYNYVPFYNKFRTVSMILVIAEFTVPLLAMLTLQKLWTGEIETQKLRNGIKYSVVITGGFALFFYMLGGNLFDFASPADGQLPLDVATAMRSERVQLLRADSLRSFIFVVLTAVAVWVMSTGKVKRWLMAMVLLLLVIADIMPVDLRYLNHDSFKPKKQVVEIVPSEANMQIMSDTEPGFRVANLTVNTFNDALTSNFHRSVGGYHPAKLARYQDVIDRYLSRMDLRIYSMLNTKYFIDAQNEKPVAKLNPDNLGAAWFVDDIAEAKSAYSELERIGEVNLARTAVVATEFRPMAKVGMNADSTRYIHLEDYKVNELTYKYKNDNNSVAVFSEIYFPDGWTAYIDGQQAPYFRANYILRAMSLPAGEHTVVFKFGAPHFALVTTITYVCSLLLLAVTLVVIILTAVKAWKRNKNA